MSIHRAICLAILAAGCAAAAIFVRDSSRHRERRELKAELRDWEDEGGNLAPAQPSGTVRPVVDD